jgi:hypothetical protein
MPRRKKDKSTEETQAQHGRKKSAASPEAEAPPVAPQQDPKLAEAERELLAKYPLMDIVPGSLRNGAIEGWGDKRM